MIDHQYLYFFHYDPEKQVCEYRFVAPIRYMLMISSIFLPLILGLFVVGLAVITSYGFHTIVVFSSVTLLGLLLTVNASLITYFGTVSGIRIYRKKYRHSEVLPAFDGVTKNMIAFIISLIIYLLSYIYLWLPNIQVSNSTLYFLPVILIGFPGGAIMYVFANWVMRIMHRVILVINHSNEMFSLKIWSKYGKYRSVRFSLADQVLIIKKNFLYKTKEDTEFPGSKAFAAIVEHNDLRYIVFWSSQELCDAFISDLRQCTGWQVTEEEAGFIERDSYECPL